MQDILDDIDFDTPLDPNVPARCPRKCELCGREIVTGDEFAKCLECHDMEYTNYDYEMDSEYLESLTYPQYLRSDHWGAIRVTKLSAAGGKCATCSSTLQLHVHHREYPRKRIEIIPTMLVVLCKRCHDLLHGGHR